VRRRTLALIAVCGVVASSAPAAAVTRVVRDREGRPITFDVQAPNVDLAAYARVMRNAVHGEEIRDVTIRIVPPGRVGAACGADEAGGCYGGFPARIIVPAGSGPAVEHVLLHEYGHHIDRTLDHRGLPEPNGTPRWWTARKMGERLRQGLVAFDYSRGWTRSVGEIFAEDYVQLHVRSSHAIGWLRPPGDGVLRALRRDLTGRATGPAPRAVPPAPPPPQDPPPTLPDGTPGLEIRRSGIVAAGERRTLPFGLLGPGRRVTFTVRPTGLDGRPGRVRIEVSCDGAPVAAAEGGEQGEVTIDRPGLGPASCEAALTGLGAPTGYDATLTLRVEGAAG
jgi:hypothetical protein